MFSLSLSKMDAGHLRRPGAARAQPCMFTLHAYKLSLSGALILLLDLRSGSTGVPGSVVVLGDTDSGG